MLLSQSVLERVLSRALCTGGDFAELFVEDKLHHRLMLINGKVEEANTGRDYGVGLRLMQGLRCIYAYTNDSSLEGLLKLAGEAAAALGTAGEDKPVMLRERIFTNIHPIVWTPSALCHDRRIAFMREAYAAARDASPEIVQAMAGYADSDQHVQIANSDGLLCEDRRIRSRLSIQAVASNGTENQTGFDGPGALCGAEYFMEHISPAASGREAARMALTMLHAPECPAGYMPVAIDNGFGGVLFHEACGHSLEATSVAKGLSEFSGKLGQRIASPVVTAIDDGTLPNAWGSLNIDDEGIPTQRKVLIEQGILKGYMIDSFNARRMNMAPTGSSRRQSYQYCPTSRMTNTYIAAGTDSDEAIITSIDKGLYAKKMGGGSVNPVTGEFNFSVAEGYWVENGRIDHPVRGASLIGKGGEILMKIDMVGQNMTMGQGMCGSMSGSIPTNVGQPLIRISGMTVGGRAAKEASK